MGLKERLLIEVGKEKEALRSLARRALDGNVDILQYAAHHLNNIKELKAFICDLEDKEDPLDLYYRYMADWDHGNANNPFEDLKPFAKLGEPSPELIEHRKQKQRHAQRRFQNLKR